MKVVVQQQHQTQQQQRSKERGRDRDREHRPPSKIRRGTWGGDRRSAAFKGRAKRRGSGRDGSSPTAADSLDRDGVEVGSSPAVFDGDAVRGSGGRTRGTGRLRSTGRGGGSIGGGSSSREVSLTREASVVGRAISPALAIVSNDDSLPLRARTASLPLREVTPVSNDATKTTPATNTVTTNDGAEGVLKPVRSGWGGRRVKGSSMKNDIGVTGHQQRSPEL